MPSLYALIITGLATITLSVSPEVGERDSARRFQEVLAVVLTLRIKYGGAEDDKHRGWPQRW
jgi:hypothetical protein